jgi:hypothetical protein
VSQQARHLSPSLAIHAHRQGIGSRSSRAVHAHSSSTSSSSAEEHTHTHAPRERERERERREEELEEEEEEEARLRSSAQQHGLELLDHFGITFLKRSFLFFLFLGGRGGGWGICFQVGREETKRQSVSQSVSLDEFDEARQSLW